MFNPIIIAAVLVDATDSHVRGQIGGCEIRRPDACCGTGGLSDAKVDQPKGQHFLLSPECRTLTILDLAKLREATAYDWFRKM